MLALMSFPLVAGGAFTLGGVFFCGVLLTGLFGLPMGLMRMVLETRGKRGRVLIDTMVMAWIASTALLFVVWLL